MYTRTAIRNLLLNKNFVVEPKQGNYNFPQNLFGVGVYVNFEETMIARSKSGNIVRVMLGKNSYHGMINDNRIFVGIKVYYPDHREHYVCVLPNNSVFEAENILNKTIEPIIYDNNETE